jgi:hypothetical protein
MLSQFLAAVMMFMSYPITFDGNGPFVGHKWAISRQDAVSNIMMTTNPPMWQCMIAYDEVEKGEIYDVVKLAMSSPEVTFGYNTEYSGRIEAYSDGTFLKIRTHHPIVAAPMHDPCWILLINDPDGSVTGTPRTDVDRLLTAINIAI